MDEFRNLALGVAHRIVAAGTDAERYDLGVENMNSHSVGDLVELAKRLLTEESAQTKDSSGAGPIQPL